MVVSDPEIVRGTPVFKGTRIPVDLVADMVAQGAKVEEILEGYLTLDKEKIAAAPQYIRIGEGEIQTLECSTQHKRGQGSAGC
jgi:uncharacterized protein (DUF433 family)